MIKFASSKLFVTTYNQHSKTSMDTKYINDMIAQAASFAESGHLDLAINLCNVALNLIPAELKAARARMLMIRGQVSYKLKNHNGALADLQDAIALDPELGAQLTGEFSKFYKEGCNH